MKKMHYLEYEKLLEQLEELRELSESLPIILEGKRDEEALRNLGINAEFFRVSNVPFHDFCEEVAKYPEVILFTDIDREGNALAGKLKHHLGRRGVKINEKIRRSLLNKLDTHQVENIYTRMSKIEEQFKGEYL